MNKDKLRVLLLVAEPWRADDGGGNTLDNFFNGIDAEYAQVYCSSKLPINDCCFKYYRITDGEVIRTFFSHKKVGSVLSDFKETNSNTNSVSSGVLQKAKQFRNELFLLIKEFIWYHSNWKTKELEYFIRDFNPDVIYAPCYASPFMLELTRWVKSITDKKVLTWSADDNYSLKQFNLSPFYWIKRFWVRKCLRETYPYYDRFLSISDEEVEELKSVVKKDIGILRKGVYEYEVTPALSSVHRPIKMIYAGGIYLNRWKILGEIGACLKKINSDEVKVVLDIYTQNKPSVEQVRILDDGRNIAIHGAVDSLKLKELYNNSDIALHVESFNLKDRLMTRLSFSTKIVDCLASGCAVMAIAWKEHTGIKYLSKNDAAICVSELDKLYDVINNMVANPDMIIKYSSRAHECCLKNHSRERNQKFLYNELMKLSK